MKKLRKLLPKRRKKKQEIVPKPTLETNMPQVTTATVAENREEVLSHARKYIYPLQHSKHKIVLFTTAILIVAVVGFFSYCVVALYQVKSYSSFLYGVTRVIPFPVAKAGPNFVSYENYLFELRHYLHYYETQQKVDFSSSYGKQQLEQYKNTALNEVINDAYVKQLAKENKVSVSSQEVDNQIIVLRNQNRLGGSQKVFEDVLKDYWGWTVNDFKRSLSTQLLAQKVVAKLDTDTQARAQAAMDELKGGTDFAIVAKQFSNDRITKTNGGEYPSLIDRTSRQVSAQTADVLFRLKTGQISGIINDGYGLEILKVIDVQGDKVRAAHIVFNFKDINSYINNLKDKEKTSIYIKI